MDGLALATCDAALPDTAPVPDWVHLFPPGRFAARDGRAFVLDDPQAVIAAFATGGIDLPVDFEHANDNPQARMGGPVPAAGWIKELRADDAGLWGRVEWTATAAEMIARKEYRFISPSFIIGKDDGRIVQLKGAGLVHNPALRLKALAREEFPMPQDKAPDGAQSPLLSKLARLLDLPEAAAEADVIMQVAQLLIPPGKAQAAAAEPDPAKYVPAAAVEAMLARQNTEAATAREERVKRKVIEAMQAGAFLPPLKDWALALGRSDEAQLDRFLAGVGTPYGHLLKQTAHLDGLPPRSGQLFASEAEAQVSAQLGLKPGALRG